MQRIVIIGAGQAGCSAAFALRKRGFDGEIILTGEEPDPPYQRPPLSKAYLLGEMARKRLHLKPAGADTDAGLLRIGCEAIPTRMPSISDPNRAFGAGHARVRCADEAAIWLGFLKGPLSRAVLDYYVLTENSVDPRIDRH
ncbi:FAD-dependent oxidoreductase [Sulfitobacter porphyrae]|uniref:FAD-dependent oxidoreductase n=1 Tax=Sulfitobacter porphyrae TaxID=1246864 RepID=A0ABW2B9Y8_9RHOB|nr:hypothetical protein GCM10007928_38580 [Sulfitobacter porphyrae]